MTTERTLLLPYVATLNQNFIFSVKQVYVEAVCCTTRSTIIVDFFSKTHSVSLAFSLGLRSHLVMHKMPNNCDSDLFQFLFPLYFTT